MRMVVDLSSIAKTALYQGKDTEFGQEVEHEGKKVWVNGWQHGYERFMGYIASTLERFHIQPHQMILVADGKSSKARRVAIYDLYKASREERPELSNIQFNLLKDEISKVLGSVGAHFVTQDGVEADDVIAYLCQHLDGDCVILSNDGDMSALISDRVSIVKDGTLITDNPLGPFPTKFIPIYKAIVGDTSDNIKGAFKFGEKAFLDFLVWAGDQGLAALEGMIKRKTLHLLVEDVTEFKPLQKIIDSADAVYKCYQVALLHPEWVNTMRQPLQWKAGMVRAGVRDERFRKYSQQVRLVTSENYGQAVDFLKKNLNVSPIFALDLETSTPDESDEWLSIRDAEAKVDVFGSEITGMGLTFGPNSQYTFYFSVDHKDTKNITKEQLKQVLEALPSSTYTVVHNASFELPVLRGSLGEIWPRNT